MKANHTPEEIRRLRREVKLIKRIPVLEKRRIEYERRFEAEYQIRLAKTIQKLI